MYSVYKVYSSIEYVRGLHIRSPLTQGASSSLASSVRGKCPVQVVYHLLSFILYLSCTFSTFRYTNTYHRVTIACRIQCSDMLQKFAS